MKTLTKLFILLILFLIFYYFKGTYKWISLTALILLFYFWFIHKEEKVKRKSIPKSVRISVLERDNYQCIYCKTGGSKDNPLEVHHKIPVEKGGADKLSNLVTACFKCNRGIGKRWFP